MDGVDPSGLQANLPYAPGKRPGGPSLSALGPSSVGWWDAVDKYGLPPGFRVAVRNGEEYIDLTWDDIRAMRAENAAAVAPFLTIMSEGVQFVVYTMPGGQIPAAIQAGGDPIQVLATYLAYRAGTKAYSVVKKLKDAGKAVGQVHHLISKRIGKAISRHKVLGKIGLKERDKRFTKIAKDISDHNGYDNWHRDVDSEVEDWLRDNDEATIDEFGDFMKDLYCRPDNRRRFRPGTFHERRRRRREFAHVHGSRVVLLLYGECPRRSPGHRQLDQCRG